MFTFDLMAQMADGLLFTKIVVNNGLDAYKVFETLNTRGLQLSTSDLLKNYLFSIVDNGLDDNIDTINKSWQEIVMQLQEVNFSDFVTVEWNSRYPLVAENALFKAIKRVVTEPANVYQYLQELPSFEI